MSNRHTVTLQALTPVWTGDAAGNGQRLLETGLTGSLRSWYEAIIRGLGRFACDATEDGCLYDATVGPESVCLACQLFGCTGLSRAFRLRVTGGSTSGTKRQLVLNPAPNENVTGRRHFGWNVPASLNDEFTLTFQSSRPGGMTPFNWTAIYLTLRLVEAFGALGGRTSQGQGVIEATDWDEIERTCLSLNDFQECIEQLPGLRGANCPQSPDLRRFVGVEVQIPAATTNQTEWWTSITLDPTSQLRPSPTLILSAPAVRAAIRAWLREPNNFNQPPTIGDLGNTRHRLMGIVEPGNARGSNVFVSHLYLIGPTWTFRIFAFVDVEEPVDAALKRLLTSPDQQKALRDVLSGNAGGYGLRMQIGTIEPYPETLDQLLHKVFGHLEVADDPA